MATLKSTLITNRDANPKVLTDGAVSGGQMSMSYGFIYTGASDAAGTNYKMVQVPSSARLSSLGFINTTLGNSSSIDTTVWYPTTVPSGGGAFLAQSVAATVISSSCFKTAILGDTTNATYLELISTANTLNYPQYRELPLWQVVGLTSDPEIEFDIGFSVRVAVATAGYIGLNATYAY